MKSQYAMFALLCVMILILVLVLVRRDRNSASAINLEDLLLGEDGKMSKAAAVLLGSFAFTTWLMCYLALTGRMTEVYFSAYMAAWVAPTVTKLIVGGRAVSAVPTPQTIQAPAQVQP